MGHSAQQEEEVCDELTVPHLIMAISKQSFIRHSNLDRPLADEPIYMRGECEASSKGGNICGPQFSDYHETSNEVQVHYHCQDSRTYHHPMPQYV